MAYKPIWDAAFDVSEPDALDELLISALEMKLMIVKYIRDGGAGLPEFTFRGTREQILKWVRECYALNDVESSFGVEDDEDQTLWQALHDAGHLTSIA